MAEPARQSGDGVPWLTEVPRSAPPAVRRKLSTPLVATLTGVLVVLMIMGAVWLGSHIRPQPEKEASTAERPGMTAQVDTSAQAEAQARQQAVAQPEPAAPLAVTNRSLADDAEEAADLPQQADVVQRTPPLAAPRATAQLHRAAHLHRPAGRATSGNLGGSLAPPLLQPVVRGRIIQTGAFPSRGEAELAWQAMVRKWPYLATKPRLISPLEVRSTDGRATQMFRVQLATASQAQSVVICQRLVAARQSCVVVY